MIRSGVRLLPWFLLLLGGSGIGAAPVTPVEANLESARLEIAASRFPSALLQLDTVLAAQPAHFEARLMRARIHSWQGKYAEASAELADLHREAPANIDVRLARASLLHYQGRSAEAVKAYRRILQANPENPEALEGLANAERAAAAVTPRWRADAGVEHSFFTRRPQPAWNQGFVQIGKFVTGPTFVYARAEVYRQFENTDAALEAGLSHRFSDRLYAAAAAGFAPDADFKPEWRVYGDAGFRFYDSPNDLRAWTVLSLWYDAYALTEVLRTSPGLRLEWGPAWAVTLRVNRVDEQGNDAVYGWSTRLDGPLPAGALFHAGYADTPETVAAATVATRTVFAGVLFPCTKSVNLDLGYTRDDRENAYIRHAFNAAVTQRF